FIERRTERHRVAGPARDYGQVVCSTRDVVACCMAVIANRGRAGGREPSHTKRKTPEKCPTICFAHVAPQKNDTRRDFQRRDYWLYSLPVVSTPLLRHSASPKWSRFERLKGATVDRSPHPCFEAATRNVRKGTILAPTNVRLLD